MKKYLPIVMFLFYACNQKSYTKGPSINDSLIPGQTEAQMRDSLKTVVHKEVYDQVYNVKGPDITNAPVKILYAIPEKNEYSNYRDIEIKYKNVSNKTISGIRFRWTGTNAFGEPADMGGMTEGYGSGFDDETLRPGKTRTSSWNVLSKDMKKVTKAWAYEIVFTDGTKWEAE